MKKTAFLSLIGIFLFSLMMTTESCKKTSTPEEEYYPPPAYSPTITAQGVKYYSSGYYFFYFELVCTSDAIMVSSVNLSGPTGTYTYNGDATVYAQNQKIYIYDEDHLLYKDGKYTFTVKGTITSGSHSGESFTKATYYELIIP